MINSEPGPHGFLLKESRELSVREAQRRIVPLWGEIAVLYHDGEPVTHDGLIELQRTASEARVSFLRDRMARGEDCAWDVAAAHRRLRRFEALQARCRRFPS